MFVGRFLCLAFILSPGLAARFAPRLQEPHQFHSPIGLLVLRGGARPATVTRPVKPAVSKPAKVSKKVVPWTSAEDDIIRKGLADWNEAGVVMSYGTEVRPLKWKPIAAKLPGRSYFAVQRRAKELRLEKALRKAKE